MFSQIFDYILSWHISLAVSFIYIVLLTVFFIILFIVRAFYRKSFPISYKSIFLAQLSLLLPMIIISYVLASKALIIGFIVVGFVGMTAETFYSYYWTVFYKKPLWEYNFGAIINRYTSTINFLAWSTGLMMFLLILAILEWSITISDEYTQFASFFLSLTILLHVIFLVGRILIQKIGDIKKWNDGALAKYLVVTIPISVPMFVASSLTDWRFLYYLLAFGISAFIAEYLYGKGLRILFGEKLWLYNYATIDDRHTSPYNIGGAIVAGVLFTYVFLLIVQL